MTPDVHMMGDKRASKLIGIDVVNDKDETIGTTDDILIGSHDKATAAVISVGGFMGFGAKLVAVPFDQLTPAPEIGSERTVLAGAAAESASNNRHRSCR